MIFFVFAGLMICRLWKINDDITLSCFVVLFIIIHPYHAEAFTFKTGCFYYGVPVFVALVGIYFAEFSCRSFLFALLCMIFALGINQIVINYIFLVICFSVLFDIIRQYKDNKIIVLKQITDNTKLFSRLAVIVLGVLLYLIINKVIMYVIHIIPEVRVGFLDFNGWPDRFIQVKSLLIIMFFKSEPILKIYPKMLMIFLSILSLFVIIKFLVLDKKSNYKTKILFLLFSFFLLMLSIIGIIGISLPLKNWWSVPRVLGTIGIFWAGIFVIAYLNNNENFLRKLLIKIGRAHV